MFFKFFVLSLVTLFSVNASAEAATYGLIPDAHWTKSCQQSGFVGRFSISHRTGNVYGVKFPQSGLGFAVFGDGPNHYAVSITGPWSEHIQIDLQSGLFSFNSSRPQTPFTCRGKITR